LNVNGKESQARVAEGDGSGASRPGKPHPQEYDHPHEPGSFERATDRCRRGRKDARLPSAPPGAGRADRAVGGENCAHGGGSGLRRAGGKAERNGWGGQDLKLLVTG